MSRSSRVSATSRDHRRSGLPHSIGRGAIRRLPALCRYVGATAAHSCCRCSTPAVVRSHPKVLLGYSDLTTLQVWQLQQAGVVAFQAPMLEGRLARGAAGYDRDALLRVVSTPEPPGTIADSLEVFRPGDARGTIVGGTLTQLASSLGGPWAFAPPAGHILFLEDVGERPYRLDRLITQLRHARVFESSAAIVLGTFPGCDEPGGSPDRA